MKGKHVNLKRVFLLNLIIRLCHIGLFLLFDTLFSDYDSSVLLHTDRLIHDSPINGLMVWDSVFFSQIGRDGYAYEQFYAFFPLFPFFSSLMGPRHIALSAHIVSLLSSVLMATCFARLSRHVLNDDALAACSTILFILNQACTFHTAAYTESLFGALTLAGLCCLYCKGKPQMAGWMIDLTPLCFASLLFTLASTSRSNGVIYSGYLIHYSLEKAIGCLHQGISRSGIASLCWVLSGAVSSALVFCPMILMQLHGQQHFCTSSSTDASIPDWCNEKPFPRIYAHVQSTYWGVGLLRYWQLKNLPNFLLAAPSLLLTSWGCLSFATFSPTHLSFLMKGALFKSDVRVWQGFHSPRVAVHLLPLAFMAACALLLMHVQVATRFLASCPALYWFVAHLITQERVNGKRPGRIERSIWALNLSYSLIGSLLFVNFYPWT